MVRLKNMSLFLGVIVICAGSVTAQERHWLKYCFGLAGEDTQRLILSTDRPEGVELPDFKSDRLLFAKWPTPMAKAGHLWIALDASDKPGVYDRLFIDSNGDGNLADESAVSAYKASAKYGELDVAKVLFEGDDGPIAYHLSFTFHNHGDGLYLKAASAGWYEGEITVNGQKLRCTLKDGNVNGSFNDSSPEPNQADQIQIETGDRLNTYYVGDPVYLDENAYLTEIARDGAYVKFLIAEDLPYGIIHLPEAITMIGVERQQYQLRIRLKDGSNRLPTGQYHLAYWTMERKDEKGNLWMLTGRRTVDANTGDFVITEGNTTTLDVGEPIIAGLNVSKEEGGYCFVPLIEGRLEENIDVDCDPGRTLPPRLRIRNADGTYDRMFDYNFECG